jgi:trans-2,3-dihydro-3-hydroxyanthranilate isomerase
VPPRSPTLGRVTAHPYVVVDVFTDTPLEGNALAVLTDAAPLSEDTLQRLARETNLSETAFVLPPEADGDARVRIFTPVTELPFAGHPTLGTACVVGERTGADTVRLETGAGLVEVTLDRDGDRVTGGRMRQPLPTWDAYEDAGALLAAVGVPASGLPVEAYVNGPRHVYVMLDNETAVAGLNPDLAALARLPVGVSCFAGSGTEWRTRMFGPALGVPEDPATGSAAGPLAVHLARHGQIPYGQEVTLRQGAEIGRPSVLRARVEGEGDRIDAVEVAGDVVTVARGEFLF